MRRSLPQRLLIGVNVVLICLTLTAAGGLGYAWHQLGRVPRIEVDPDAFLPPKPPGQPQNFLLVGSDSRAFVAGGDDLDSFGTQDGQRADVILLVRVDPRSKTAAMLSFPRDLWIPIAPDGHEQRINTALAGKPEGLLATLREEFGVGADHYAQVDFEGFRELVGAIGGVTVYLPGPVRDRDADGVNWTGLDIRERGCVELDGAQALAYVRSRHFETFEDGRWVPDRAGDLDRIKRQQDFIRRVARKSFRAGLTNPLKLNRLADVAARNLQLSDSIDPRDLVALGRNFRSLGADTIQQYTVPVVNWTTPGGAQVLRIDETRRDELERILDVFRGAPTAPPASPTTTSVRVLNGSRRQGEAVSASTALQALHFSVVPSGNSATSARTEVRYAAGHAAEAALVQRHLVGPSVLRQVSTVNDVDVEVVTGTDFTGVRSTPAAAVAAAPPTTAPVPATPAC